MEVLPDLVDSQQKGFISGRSITDNVLAFKVGQEWANKSNQKSLFVKLDFEKAYDRVDHGYLWKTMQAMNISENFIDLTKCLVEGATSKIHALGKFSKEIPLERGVRQGCPLAPLLFALATQPLMTILKSRAAEGRLPGLKIKANKDMLYSLFADDSGVFIQAEESAFLELQEAVRCYERISGARLNLSKSTVIPLGQDEIPEWLHNSGCHITQKGEIVRYLGFPIGWGISDSDQTDYIIAKLRKKLGTWVFHILPFAGRVIVLKHVLRAVPIHLLACLNLQAATLKAIEGVCRTFLWGTNKDGNKKIPMIAWEEIQRPKSEGGLNFTALINTSAALRLKQATKILTRPGEEWVLEAEKLIQSVNSTGRAGQDRQTWSIQEVLLLQCPRRIPGAPTVSGLVQAWNLARPKLQLENGSALESVISSTKFVALATSQGWISEDDKRVLLKTITRYKLEDTLKWQNWARDHQRILPEPRDIDTTRRLGRAFQLIRSRNSPIEQWGWYWKPCSARIEGWELDTKTWRKIIQHIRPHEVALNKKWARTYSTRSWAKKLRRLWKSYLPTRDKVWTWKILQDGLPTMERAARWGHETNICKRCGLATETSSHLFVFCSAVEPIWRNWNLIIWLDWNAATYSSQPRSTPFNVAGKLASLTALAMLQHTRQGSRMETEVKEALTLLHQMFPTNEESTSADTRCEDA
ncbi:hypothetical protein R1sor_000382 [Riccia sorocarpa]|uniref:Reverse transcriptase domain-containing protein n=1 Tax=Riccia sorocarpa TaxID=122646 RepID=A0ABD3GW60_9MARC